eukprot:gene9005-9085_t
MQAAPETSAISGETILARFLESGYQRAEPAILQPASIFLDQSGEDIRGRLYFTADAGEQELCLRPEYTIPVCRAYLASKSAGTQAAFAYCGPVFRLRTEGKREFIQSGLESFGRSDLEAADAEIFALTLQAVADVPLTVRIGDMAVLAQVLHALDLPPFWLRRIKRGLAAGQTVETIFAVPARVQSHDHSGVLAALEGVDRKGARALVEDLLSIAGISAVGGRSVGEIADRFLQQSALKSQSQLSDAKRDILQAFLAISGHPDQVCADMRAFASAHKLELGAELDAFEMRNGFMAAHGIDLGALVFSASFVRNLDYYTGFIFEARREPSARPCLGGGRYDRLLGTLGAAKDIPAVGAAIWVARLAGDIS